MDVVPADPLDDDGRGICEDGRRRLPCWLWLCQMALSPNAQGQAFVARLALSKSHNMHRVAAPQLARGGGAAFSHTQPADVVSCSDHSHDDNDDDNVTVVSHSTYPGEGLEVVDDEDWGVSAWALPASVGSSRHRYMSLVPHLCTMLEAVSISCSVGLAMVSVLALSAAIFGWPALVLIGCVSAGVWWALDAIVLLECTPMPGSILRSVTLRLHQLYSDDSVLHHHMAQALPIGEQCHSTRVLFAFWATMISWCAPLSPHPNRLLELLRRCTRACLWSNVVLMHAFVGMLLLLMAIIAVGGSWHVVRSLDANVVQRLSIPLHDQVVSFAVLHAPRCGAMPVTAAALCAVVLLTLLLLGRLVEPADTHRTDTLVARVRKAGVTVACWAASCWSTTLFHTGVVLTTGALLCALVTIVLSEKPAQDLHRATHQVPAPATPAAGEGRIYAMPTSIDDGSMSVLYLADKLWLAFGGAVHDMHGMQAASWTAWIGVVAGGAVWGAFAAATVWQLWHLQFPSRLQRARRQAARCVSENGHSLARIASLSPPTSPHVAAPTSSSPPPQFSGPSGLALRLPPLCVSIVCLLVATLIALATNTKATVVGVDTRDTMRNVTQQHDGRANPYKEHNGAFLELYMMQRFLPVPLPLIWLHAPMWVADAYDRARAQHAGGHSDELPAPRHSVCYLPGATTVVQQRGGNAGPPTVTVDAAAPHLWVAWSVLLFGVISLFESLFWFHGSISFAMWSIRSGSVRQSAPDLLFAYDDIWIGRHDKKRRLTSSAAQSAITVQTTNHWRHRRGGASARGPLRRWRARATRVMKSLGSVIRKWVRGLRGLLGSCCSSRGASAHVHGAGSPTLIPSVRSSNGFNAHETIQSIDGRLNRADSVTRRSHSNPSATRRSIHMARNEYAAGSATPSSSLPIALDPTVRVATRFFSCAPHAYAFVMRKELCTFPTSPNGSLFIMCSLLGLSGGLCAMRMLHHPHEHAPNEPTMSSKLMQNMTALVFSIAALLGAPCVGLLVWVACRRSHGALAMSPEAIHKHQHRITRNYEGLMRKVYNIHVTAVAVNLESQHRLPTGPDADATTRDELRRVDYFAKMRSQSTNDGVAPKKQTSRRLADTEQLLRSLRTDGGPRSKKPLRRRAALFVKRGVIAVGGVVIVVLVLTGTLAVMSAGVHLVTLGF